MDKEFLRMQQLAGIPDINIDNNSFQKITLEYITELYLLKKYYSKGILKENLSKNEIILIESKLTKINNEQWKEKKICYYIEIED